MVGEAIIQKMAEAIQKVPYLPVAEEMLKEWHDSGGRICPPEQKIIYAEWCKRQAQAAWQAYIDYLKPPDPPASATYG